MTARFGIILFWVGALAAGILVAIGETAAAKWTFCVFAIIALLRSLSSRIIRFLYFGYF